MDLGVQDTGSGSGGSRHRKWIWEFRDTVSGSGGSETQEVDLGVQRHTYEVQAHDVSTHGGHLESCTLTLEAANVLMH